MCCSLLLPVAIDVEFSEVSLLEDVFVSGGFTDSAYVIERDYGGVDPIDNDCYGGKCVGFFTRVCDRPLPRFFFRR